MSKKEQAIELFKSITDSYSKALWHYSLHKQQGSSSDADSRDYFKALAIQSEVKLEVMMGAPGAAYFDALIDQRSAAFGCGENDISFRCIEVAKEIGLNILETWVWTE